VFPPFGLQSLTQGGFIFVLLSKNNCLAYPSDHGTVLSSKSAVTGCGLGNAYLEKEIKTIPLTPARLPYFRSRRDEPPKKNNPASLSL